MLGKRVGITTRPIERRKEWEREYPSMFDWRIIRKNLSRDKAQQEEYMYVLKGFEGHSGGQEPEKNRNNWYVYTFNY